MPLIALILKALSKAKLYSILIYIKKKNNLKTKNKKWNISFKKSQILSL
jgi:hypothetical protein